MIIYKWTNTVNGKIYIGQTTKSLRHRTRMHINSSNSGTTFPLHLAIQKYGKEAFIVEQIAVAFSRDQLNKLEIDYIRQFDCLSPKGYNLRVGGDSLEWHPEMRHKASISAKARMAKDGGAQNREALELAWVVCKGRVPWNKGVKVTNPVTLQRLSESHKGKPAPNRKPVRCNETNQVFESGLAAAKALGLQPGHVSSVLNGKRKSTGGFTFSFVASTLDSKEHSDEKAS